MTRARRKKRFVVCIENHGWDDLEVRHVYEQLPDDVAAEEELLRIIDESGEDYLYPANCFVPIELPLHAERRLTTSVPARLRERRVTVRARRR